MGVKEQLASVATRSIPVLAPGATSEVLGRMMQLAIDGIAKFPGARASAGSFLTKSNGDVEAAIRAIIKRHTLLAGAQGFATNVGGVVTMAVAFPANLAGLLTIQARMVAAIAHLRGYDIGDSRVHTAILMCLLGDSEVDKLIVAGELPSTPHVVATAPLKDPKLNETVGRLVLSAALARIGGKRFATVLLRRIPVVGGGVGAANDSLSTSSIGLYARKQFVSRRG